MTEGQIQAGVRAYLDKMGIFYINPRFAKRSTIKASWPDFTLVNSNRVSLQESKTAKGTLTDGQKELFPKLARDAGCVVHICRSVEDHIRVTQEWLGTLETPSKGEIMARELRERANSLTRAQRDELMASAVSTLAADKNPVAGVVGGKELIPAGDTVSAWDYATKISPVKGTERIGSWQGNRWLIRNLDGQETMIRIATPADIARVGLQNNPLVGAAAAPDQDRVLP